MLNTEEFIAAEMRIIITIRSLCSIISVISNPTVARTLTIIPLEEVELLFILSYRPLKITNLSKNPRIAIRESCLYLIYPSGLLLSCSSHRDTSGCTSKDNGYIIKIGGIKSRNIGLDILCNRLPCHHNHIFPVIKRSNRCRCGEGLILLLISDIKVSFIGSSIKSSLNRISNINYSIYGLSPTLCAERSHRHLTGCTIKMQIILCKVMGFWLVCGLIFINNVERESFDMVNSLVHILLIIVIIICTKACRERERNGRIGIIPFLSSEVILIFVIARRKP